MKRRWLSAGFVVAILCAGGLRANAQAAEKSGPVAGTPETSVAEHTVDFVCVLGLTFVKARVNGTPLDMVLDTGASYTVLKPEIAAELGLKSGGESTQAAGLGKGADETLHLVKGVTLEFAGETLKDRTIAMLPVGYIDSEAGQKTDGILGSDIFLSYVVHEDYAGRKVTLIAPEKFVAPAGFVAVPLIVSGTASLLQLKLQPQGESAGTVTEGTFVLDSGLAAQTLFLLKPFVDAHPGLRSGKVLEMPVVAAVGGDLRLSEGRLAGVGVGPFMLADPVVVFQDVSAGRTSAALAGIVGTGMLRRFDVIFDYPHGKLWLKPNAEFGKPVEGMSSGLQFTVSPPEFHRVMVKGVIAGSPAAEAGLAAGDEIVAVGHRRRDVEGKSAGKTELTLAGVREFMEAAGQEIYLAVSRNGKRQVVNFKTRAMI
jgi:hypothetical protein